MTAAARIALAIAKNFPESILVRLRIRRMRPLNTQRSERATSAGVSKSRSFVTLYILLGPSDWKKLQVHS